LSSFCLSLFGLISQQQVTEGVFEGWWFVHVNDSEEQGWAPGSCLLPENREELGEHVVAGKICPHLIIYV